MCILAMETGLGTVERQFLSAMILRSRWPIDLNPFGHETMRALRSSGTEVEVRKKPMSDRLLACRLDKNRVL